MNLSLQNHSFQAVFFDLDDTIFDAEHCYARALEALGLSMESPEFVQARAQVKARLGADTSARNRLLYFKRLLEVRSPGSFSANETLRMMDAYEKALEQAVMENWESLKSTRIPFLQKVAELWPVAIITNENLRTQLLKLRAVDPNASLFPVVVTSEEAGCEKPQRAIFEWACHRMGVEAGRSLMVGDNWDTDIEGALAAGMKAVWVTEFSKKKSEDDVRERLGNRSHEVGQVSRLEDLLDLLRAGELQ